MTTFAALGRAVGGVGFCSRSAHSATAMNGSLPSADAGPVHSDGAPAAGSSSKEALRKLLASTTVAEHQARYTKGELIGQGAQKKVYKAFDEELGLEVAWNEVAVAELAWTSDKDRDRIFSEIRVLKQLKHKNIITLHDWWFDPKISSICFITELFTDGTLRQYRRKHRNVDLVVLKRWAWQILQGLVYLHGHNPPIIHRDLKSDNIFVNGSSGVVKIGDLGFATMRAGLSMAMSVIGTPEFMAPELYEESYNEKVDVYSFGLCMLELDTLEYPYAECKNAAQIFKKVTSGQPPAGLEKVSCEELKSFISTCICHDPSKRPEARQLLKHPFFDCMRGLAACKSGVMLSSLSGAERAAGTRGSSPGDAHSGQPSPVGGAGQVRQPPLSLPLVGQLASEGLAPCSAGARTEPGPNPVSHNGSSRLALSTFPEQVSPTERAGSASSNGGTTASSPGGGGSHLAAALAGLQEAHGGALAPSGCISAAALGGRARGSHSISAGGAGMGSPSGTGADARAGAAASEVHMNGAGEHYVTTGGHRPPPPPALAQERSISGNGANGGSGANGAPLPAYLSASPSSPFSIARHHDPRDGTVTPAPYPQSHGHPERQSSLDTDLTEGDILFASDRGAMVSAHSIDADSPERPLHELVSVHGSSSMLNGFGNGVPIPACGGGRLPSWSEGTAAEDGASSGYADSAAAETSAASSLRPDLSMRLNMNCRPTQDDGTLSFSLSFVNHSGMRRKVGFLYNLEEDQPVQIANEMVENLSLKVEEAEFIAQMIQHQVAKYPASTPCGEAEGAREDQHQQLEQQQHVHQLPQQQHEQQHQQLSQLDQWPQQQVGQQQQQCWQQPGAEGSKGDVVPASLKRASTGSQEPVTEVTSVPYQEDDEDVPSCFF